MVDVPVQYPDEPSVTECLMRLKADDSFAQQEIWRRYHERLVNRAYRHMVGMRKRVADEEDVALAAFETFLRGVKEGRFPKLDDRDDLWQVLIMLTERQAISQRRHENAIKRGSGNVRGESAFEHVELDDGLNRGIEAVMDKVPTEAFVDGFCESIDTRLNQLSDEMQRKVAMAKMEGYSISEISERLGVSKRTVERKLNLIRLIWTQSETDQDESKDS